jgi:threonine/homoserine/homoserine lactone efflux protein
VIVEFPLVILITLGLGQVFQSPTAKVCIGLIGGLILIWMAVQMLRSIKDHASKDTAPTKDRPILAGILLSAGNPYFLLWWATVGLKLATDARQLGIWAFGLFALVHWFCDATWLSILSWASFKGTVLLGPHRQRIVLAICALAMALFGVKFVYDAFALLLLAGNPPG